MLVETLSILWWHAMKCKINKYTAVQNCAPFNLLINHLCTCLIILSHTFSFKVPTKFAYLHSLAFLCTWLLLAFYIDVDEEIKWQCVGIQSSLLALYTHNRIFLLLSIIIILPSAPVPAPSLWLFSFFIVSGYKRNSLQAI